MLGRLRLGTLPRGIRINEVEPGVIGTPMIGHASEDEMQPINARIAAQPREVATAVAFLLADDASCITDAHFAVDGGFLT
ncbi:SDR family oxidoreductase [Streptomyces avermitilis]